PPSYALCFPSFARDWASGRATRRYKRVKRRPIHSRVLQFFLTASGGRQLAGITELLIGWNQGDKGALDRLIPLVYDELRIVARHRLAAEDSRQTLESAALVNETYLRL